MAHLTENWLCAQKHLSTLSLYHFLSLSIMHKNKHTKAWANNRPIKRTLCIQVHKPFFPNHTLLFLSHLHTHTYSHANPFAGSFFLSFSLSVSLCFSLSLFLSFYVCQTKVSTLVYLNHKKICHEKHFSKEFWIFFSGVLFFCCLQNVIFISIALLKFIE
jgi:hypothetical protein